MLNPPQEPAQKGVFLTREVLLSSERCFSITADKMLYIGLLSMVIQLQDGLSP